MDEQALRGLIADVKDGKLSRRDFINRMVARWTDRAARGPDAELFGRRARPDEIRLQADQARRRRAAQDPVVAGRDAAQSAFRDRHQGSGRLAHLLRAARELGPGGYLFPVLAAEIPDLENGGLSKDGKSVTWKLKQGVTWHDGKPFTADDVVFNWRIRGRPGDRGDHQSAPIRTSRSRRSTTTRCACCSPSRRRSGLTPSSACAG